MERKYVVPLMIVGYAGMLYMRHKQMKGKYKADGSYPRSAMKHDLAKQTVLDLFPLLLFPLTKQEFYNQADPLNSFSGRWMMSLIAYFVFYQLVEPYVLPMMPDV